MSIEHVLISKLQIIYWLMCLRKHKVPFDLFVVVTNYLLVNVYGKADSTYTYF